jgi:hypothetical protein
MRRRPVVTIATVDSTPPARRLHCGCPQRVPQGKSPYASCRRTSARASCRRTSAPGPCRRPSAARAAQDEIPQHKGPSTTAPQHYGSQGSSSRGTGVVGVVVARVSSGRVDGNGSASERHDYRPSGSDARLGRVRDPRPTASRRFVHSCGLTRPLPVILFVPIVATHRSLHAGRRRHAALSGSFLRRRQAASRHRCSACCCFSYGRSPAWTMRRSAHPPGVTCVREAYRRSGADDGMRGARPWADPRQCHESCQTRP